MSKKHRYQSPVPFKQKAAEAKGWDGIVETIRNQLQENCDLMTRKNVGPTKLVGFYLDIHREIPNQDKWRGDMILRFNNNLLSKNVLRYNFRNAFKWEFNGYGYGTSNYWAPKELQDKAQSWYKLNNDIRDRRHKGIFDFVSSKITSVKVVFSSEKWPGMYYDELFDMIENSGNRRSSYSTIWEDPSQVELDNFMLKEILKSC